MQREVRPFEMHLVLGPEALDDGERLLEPARALRGVKAKGLELLLLVPQADAEDELAACDLVEGGDLLRDVDRVLERQQDDACAEPHIARLRRQPAEERRGLENLDGVAEVVLARQRAVEAQGAREPHLLDEGAHALRHGLAGRVLRAEEQTELHVRLLPGLLPP